MAITAYICGQQSLFRAANRCRLEASGGAVAVFTPYSAGEDDDRLTFTTGAASP